MSDIDTAEVDTVEIETGPNPVGSIVWLHGLGADGHDFEPIVPELALPEQLPLRFVFPHAPVRPVTINGGIAMRAWFDILSFDRAGRAEPSSLEQSSTLLLDLVERERNRGIRPDRIVLAGFSQGGAVVLHTIMQQPLELAGIMALTTFLPAFDAGTSEAPGDTSTPVFMAHGSYDPVLPLVLGRECAATLEQLGYRVEWHEYPMAHAVCPQEIVAIRDWLLRVYSTSQ